MILRLILRLVQREGLHGELRWFVLALALSVACVLSVALVADRLDQSLSTTGREFLAADYVLQSGQPISPDWLQAAEARGLQHSLTTSFTSMLFHGEAMQLASIKAVGDGYPFYGKLELAPAEPIRAGQIWLSPRLQALLGVAVGDELELGSIHLRVAGKVLQEPDEGFSPFLLAPRALIHQTDLARAQLILPGSRVAYRYLLKGEAAALADWRAWLAPRLVAGQRLLGPDKAGGIVSRQLERSERFFRLASLIGLLLGCLAMSLAMHHFAQRQSDMVALLKTLGAGRLQLWRLMGGVLLVLMGASFVLGGSVGLLLHQGFVWLLGNLLPPDLPPPSPQPFVLGLLVSLFVTLLLSLVPFLRLLKVPPLRVLRSELEAGIPNWLSLPLIFSGTLLLAWLFTGDALLSLGLFAGMLAGLLLLGAMAFGLLHLLPLSRPGSGRFLAVTQLRRERWHSLSRLAGVALALMLIGVLAASRQAIMGGFAAQLPADIPNRFLINIADSDKPALEQLLAQEGIRHSGLYPVVRGRLVSINGEALAQSDDATGRPGIHRELTMTWQAQPPAHNRLLEGRWWSATDRELVSVESGVAQRLGIHLGDKLTFAIDGQSLLVTVTSLRQVNWEDMQPNFFMIFSPDVLAHYPVSWLASLRVPQGQSRLELALVRQFPTVSLINTDEILTRLQQVFDKVSRALMLMLGLVMVAALLVLLVQVQVSLSERWRSLLLMRTLGAGSALLRSALQWEQATTGGLAGLSAALATELVMLALHKQWSELPWAPHPWLWAGLPLLGALLVSGVTRGMVRRMLGQVLAQRLRALD